MPQQYSTFELAQAAWQEEFNELLEATMLYAHEEAAAIAAEAVADAASEVLDDSEAVNAYLEALEEAYQNAMDAIDESFGEHACYKFCSDINNNGIPDSWEAWDEYIKGLEELDNIKDDFDISGDLNDAYAQVYEETLQDLLDHINIDLPISDFWADEDQDIVNFDDDVSPEDQEAINAVFQALCDNCLYSALVEQVRGQGVGYANDPVRLPPGTGGLYDPALNSVVFDGNMPSLDALAAELFHAYQEQLHGDLQAIKDHPDNLGGSNIEFEETLMSTPSLIYIITEGEYPPGGSATFPGMEGVDVWLLGLAEDNGGTFPTSFNATQQAEYLGFVEQFRAYHDAAGTPGIRDGAVDPNKNEPDAIFNLLQNSDCN